MLDGPATERLVEPFDRFLQNPVRLARRDLVRPRRILKIVEQIAAIADPKEAKAKPKRRAQTPMALPLGERSSMSLLLFA